LSRPTGLVHSEGAHRAGGKSAEDTAVREIAEKAGIIGPVIAPVGVIDL
jgi:ADP-ribose pyrophosphatase YjhB (NUDIX family)